MSDRPKLAVVCTHPVQYQVPLWRALVAAGWELKVFYSSDYLATSGYDPGFATSFAWDLPLLDGYPNEVVPSRRMPAFLGRIRDRWGPGDRWPIDLLSRLRVGHWDALLVHGYVSGAAWAGGITAKRLGIPIILRGESHDFGRRNSLRHVAWRRFLRVVLRRVDAFLAVGTRNLDLLCALGVPRPKIQVAYYAVDNEFFRRAIDSSPGKSARLRQGWGVGPADVVVGFVGKLAGYKAPDLLLRAVAQLRQRGKGVHVVIVGSGSLDGELRTLQASLGLTDVHWIGFVNQGEMPFYYHAMDVLVLPSIFEAWGLVLNEAMACGVPCIASDVVGAVPDLIEGRGTGLTFPAGDVAKLTGCLDRAHDLPTRKAWASQTATVMSEVCFAQNVDALGRTVSRLREAWSSRGRPGSPGQVRSEHV
jgi:glycosyltransferase involved in cell wall biosynthesis